MASDEVNLCCSNCGYSLKGLPRRRCPECGQTFDPALLLESTADLRAGGIWSRRLALQLLGFFVFLLCSTFAAASAADLTHAAWWMLAAAINSYTLASYTAEAQRRAGVEKPEAETMLWGVILCFHFGVWAVALFILMLFSMLFY
jgi:hypothetical protein